MDDKQILDLYWERSEAAISETSKKYGKYCRYIAFNILRNDEDSEECVNDTYLRAWNSIPPNRPSVLKTFLGKITRNLSLDRYELLNAKKRNGEELLKQDEPEAQEIALAIELFTDGSLDTFAKHTNVDTHSRLICYDILDLGKQLQPIGMLVVLDSILNRITQNRAKGRNTFIFIDEIYLLFQHEYSATEPWSLHNHNVRKSVQGFFCLLLKSYVHLCTKSCRKSSLLGCFSPLYLARIAKSNV